MKTLSPRKLIVLLEGIDATTAYNWGCEAGAFMQYDNLRLLGQHIIYAGNAGVIEMICIQRRMEMEVLKEQGDKLNIKINMKGRKR
jgi:hypothetical protein